MNAVCAVTKRAGAWVGQGQARSQFVSLEAQCITRDLQMATGAAQLVTAHCPWLGTASSDLGTAHPPNWLASAPAALHTSVGLLRHASM